MRIDYDPSSECVNDKPLSAWRNRWRCNAKVPPVACGRARGLASVAMMSPSTAAVVCMTARGLLSAMTVHALLSTLPLFAQIIGAPSACCLSSNAAMRDRRATLLAGRDHPRRYAKSLSKPALENRAAGGRGHWDALRTSRL